MTKIYKKKKKRKMNKMSLKISTFVSLQGFFVCVSYTLFFFLNPGF